MDPDLRMRVVLLRADEAAELQRTSTNRVPNPCCPHMSIFHWSVERPDGTRIRACNINKCDCYDETPPDSSRRRIDAEDAMLAKRSRLRRFAIWAVTWGAMVGGGIALGELIKAL